MVGVGSSLVLVCVLLWVILWVDGWCWVIFESLVLGCVPLWWMDAKHSKYTTSDTMLLFIPSCCSCRSCRSCAHLSIDVVCSCSTFNVVLVVTSC